MILWEAKLYRLWHRERMEENAFSAWNWWASTHWHVLRLPHHFLHTRPCTIGMVCGLLFHWAPSWRWFCIRTEVIPIPLCKGIYSRFVPSVPQMSTSTTTETPAYLSTASILVSGRRKLSLLFSEKWLQTADSPGCRPPLHWPDPDTVSCTLLPNWRE